MLLNWADRVYLLDGSLRAYEMIPVEFREKLIIIDVGQDRWGSETNGELRALLTNKLKELL